MKPIKEIWTIGQSTLPIDRFIAILQSSSIELVADIRSFPGSKRYPHFNKENLSKSLNEAEIEYVHMPALGGRRRPLPNSTNKIWQNEAFRGYADYMDTEEF